MVCGNTINRAFKKVRNNFLLIIIIVTISALIFLVLSINSKQLIFDYTNNATIAKTELEAQTVPTVINGIISSTSVIIGFSATVVALMYREIAKRNESSGWLLFALLPIFILSIVYQFYAFLAFSNGGQGFLEFAFRNALIGFVSSIFTLFLALLLIVYIMERNVKREKATA